MQQKGRKMAELIRQGDILLRKIEDEGLAKRLRKEGTNVPRVRGKGLIIALGEATGHHHRVLTKGVRVIQRDGKRYLVVPQGTVAEFVHEEHETLLVGAGVHEISNQREYEPSLAAKQRRVYD